MAEEQVQAVLDFWFGDTGAQAPSAADSKRWYGGGEALDREIEQRFAGLLQRPLEDWLEAPRSCLAYVVVHDQFPLNIYRGQARAFAFEARAEAATQLAIERGYDRDMGYGERVFLLMPLMHAENLALQDLGVQQFGALVESVDESLREAAEGTLRFAREHRDTIARFGRFPFRNAVLGRESTAEEQAFLDAGAPRYGQ